MTDIKYSDVFYIVRNFLSSTECEMLIDEHNSRKDEEHVESYGNALTNKIIKSTYKAVSVLPTSENFNLLHKKTQSLFNEWINYLDSLGCFYTEQLKRSVKYVHDYRILKYEVNQSIHPHTDWDYFTHASATFNLNNSYSGGEFVFFNGKYEINLGIGDALIFPASPFWVHEVKTITSGTRYSANCFLRTLPDEYTISLVGHVDMLSISPPLLNSDYCFLTTNSDDKKILNYQ